MGDFRQQGRALHPGQPRSSSAIAACPGSAAGLALRCNAGGLGLPRALARTHLSIFLAAATSRFHTCAA